ncbi:VanZ family protein [Winogradskyella sp. R77965]|uniref:VanZ family protein n=1 Tax=Winogradskyella sp. R77965 TaxID=3093872 RepID=UPI0037DD5831
MVKKLFLIVALVYTIWLTVISLVDLKNVPSLGSSFDDKIYHFIAYFGLGYLWVTYFKSNPKKYIIFIVFTGTIVFGVILELLQHRLNPNRTYDNYDLMANCFGVIIGTLIASRFNIIKLK